MTTFNILDKLKFHPLIDPFVGAYSAIVAAYLGWRLLKKEEFVSLLNARGGDDRVGLAVDVLRQDQQHISFSFRRSVEPLVSGNCDHFRVLAPVSQQLIGHCWEILREAGIVPDHGSSVIEFFRHVRNGCFHGNRFLFYRGEPKYRTEWRGLIIDSSFQGRKLFRDSIEAKDYFLNVGDPILLLHDITNEIS